MAIVGPKVPWRAYVGGGAAEEEGGEVERKACWRAARNVKGMRLVEKRGMMGITEERVSSYR